MLEMRRVNKSTAVVLVLGQLSWGGTIDGWERSSGVVVAVLASVVSVEKGR